METELNISYFFLPSLFISEKISEVLKNKNITVNDRVDHQNVFNQWVIDWLRVKKNIHIIIEYDKLSIKRWSYVFKDISSFAGVYSKKEYDSYEECQEAAIIAALELV